MSGTDPDSPKTVCNTQENEETKKVRRKVFWFAVTSRITVYFLQLVFNILIPDHDPDVFKTPALAAPVADDATGNKNSPGTDKPFHRFDNLILDLFAGLTRWDGQYFLHVANYGYSYENTLAFYPLYPVTIRIVATLLTGICPTLGPHGVATVIAAIFINFVCFVKSAVLLYDLGACTLSSRNVAYKAAILYCVNPASIFFSAAYSESLFTYLTFHVMLASVKRTGPIVSLPLALSMLARSNGTVNLGFPLYIESRILLRNFVSTYAGSLLRPIYSRGQRRRQRQRQRQQNHHRHHHHNHHQQQQRPSWKKTGCSLLATVLLSLTPLVLLQFYNYALFCIPQDTENSDQFSVPPQVADYGRENGLVFPGNGSAAWCRAQIPIAYSYVQAAYWNVGFLNYYQAKQIPNFILASPILYIMLTCTKEYLLEHKKRLLNNFGLSVTALSSEKRREVTTINHDQDGSGHDDDDDNNDKTNDKYPRDLYIFVMHGLFLTLFCISFIHIQVSTRLICSASPLPYWYCALTLSNTRKKPNTSFDDRENLDSKWKVFFLSQRRYSLPDKLVLSYFLGYTVLGCLMFPNFLPWT